MQYLKFLSIFLVAIIIFVLYATSLTPLECNWIYDCPDPDLKYHYKSGSIPLPSCDMEFSGGKDFSCAFNDDGIFCAPKSGLYTFHVNMVICVRDRQSNATFVSYSFFAPRNNGCLDFPTSISGRTNSLLDEQIWLSGSLSFHLSHGEQLEFRVLAQEMVEESRMVWCLPVQNIRVTSLTNPSISFTSLS